ncbi:hypothetical protein SAMN05192560_0763 [Methylobacillus rhizosphaerae]|uniref:Uncharacterized protein n=1 Tax=Methylobacillus rhizosphaerae TaxID=551994 RepID=A0A238YS99_9PROT|nr:hypothetical protein SAMN05192560_0763 [Methylobacillus rhizosphaerae]
MTPIQLAIGLLMLIVVVMFIAFISDLPGSDK